MFKYAFAVLSRILFHRVLNPPGYRPTAGSLPLGTLFLGTLSLYSVYAINALPSFCNTSFFPAFSSFSSTGLSSLTSDMLIVTLVSDVLYAISGSL